jgi:hypothetical protein
MYGKEIAPPQTAGWQSKSRKAATGSSHLTMIRLLHSSSISLIYSGEIHNLYQFVLIF